MVRSSRQNSLARALGDVPEPGPLEQTLDVAVGKTAHVGAVMSASSGRVRTIGRVPGMTLVTSARLSLAPRAWRR